MVKFFVGLILHTGVNPSTDGVLVSDSLLNFRRSFVVHS